MIKDIVSITHIENQRHSAHYETALIDLKNDACDLNPLIKFEEFIISGPVFQPSPHAGVLRLTLLLPDSTGSLSICVGEDTQLLTPGELFCMNSGSGVVYEERVSSVNCYVHGISILLNTHSTLKKCLTGLKSFNTILKETMRHYVLMVKKMASVNSD
ncbi:hypothetical protein LOZ86_02570 [Pectobacterium parvum]|uniref:pirin family protein n=1 Tax=Pectobacterium TaxID=122277 RepID=UPI0013FD6905|nr:MULTISPECIES: pirin family protein [Pectobacterium]UFK39800.1 hypothetical protein LOZ86_02570 [Pectobacterium parvum]